MQASRAGWLRSRTGFQRGRGGVGKDRLRGLPCYVVQSDVWVFSIPDALSRQMAEPRLRKIDKAIPITGRNPPISKSEPEQVGSNAQ